MDLACRNSCTARDILCKFPGVPTYKIHSSVDPTQAVTCGPRPPFSPIWNAWQVSVNPNSLHLEAPAPVWSEKGKAKLGETFGTLYSVKLWAQGTPSETCQTGGRRGRKTGRQRRPFRQTDRPTNRRLLLPRVDNCMGE